MKEENVKDFIFDTLSYLMTVSPYDAATLYQLKFIEDKSIKNICGVNLYEFKYNPSFFVDTPMTTMEFAFILRHEARHILYNHITRRSYIDNITSRLFRSEGLNNSLVLDRIKYKTWNYATDIAVNDILVKECWTGDVPPCNLLYSGGMEMQAKESAEYYFDILIKQAIEKIKQNEEHRKKREEEERKKEEKRRKREEKKEEKEKNKESDNSDNQDEDLDEPEDSDVEEFDNDNSETEESNEENSDSEQTNGSSEETTEDNIEKEIDDILDDIAGGYKNLDDTDVTDSTIDEEVRFRQITLGVSEVIKSCGIEPPESIKEALNPVSNKQKNWKQKLQQLFTRAIKGRPNYKKPNRRQHSTELIFPNRKEKTCEHTAIAIDESGSIDHVTLSMFYNHISNLMDQLKIQKLRVMIFTTRVVYSEDVTSKELRELCNNRIACGGTRLHPILDDAIENKINNLIIFTDCVSFDLSETIKDAGKVKIVWCHYTEDYTTEEWKRHNPRYVPTGKVLNIRRKPE